MPSFQTWLHLPTAVMLLLISSGLGASFDPELQQTLASAPGNPLKTT
jgi:hypothetical protein